MNNYNDLYEYDDIDESEGCLTSLLTFVVVILITFGLVTLLLRLFTGK